MTEFSILLSFWIYQDSKYAWVTQGPKKMLHQRCLTGSEYFSGSQYGRILNMSELHKILNKTLHYIYLIGFWICLQFLNGRVTENWGFCVNCTLEVHGVNCILTVKRLMLFWICLRFSIYHDFECIRNLNMLEFHRVYWQASQYTLKARQKFR